MNTVDIIIVIVVAVAVVGVIGWLIYGKIKRKGGCCDCGCSGCTACDKYKNQDKQR